VTPGEEGAAAGPDSEECLLVVAGYADIAPVLKTVTAEAAARVITSPELGDFFELRFADLGRRPEPRSGPAEAAASIADELTRPRGTAGRSFFALVIADRSAAAAADLLAACAAHPIVARLPIRCRGLASIDDREPERVDDREPEPGAPPHALPHAEIVIPLGGGWDQPGLVRELRRYAAEVHEDFAAGSQPGVILDQLGWLRSGGAEEPSDGPAAQDPDAGNPATGDPAAGHPDPAPRSALLPDALAPRLEDPVPPAEPDAGPSPGPRPTAVPSRAGAMARRLLTLPRRRGQAAAAEAAPRPATAIGRPVTPMLAYLILLADEGTDDRAGWRRGRSVLLEMDKALADPAPGRCMVRALSAGNGAMSAPRPAGQLKRNDLGQPMDSLDFPRVLGIIRSTIQRDRALLAASSATVGPAVVFFASDVPLADAVTAGVHAELARETSVTWIVPEHSADLISPGFAADGAWLIPDHQAVAAEVISLVRGAGTAENHATTADERTAG
jgi:hypothetical protein